MGLELFKRAQKSGGNIVKEFTVVQFILERATKYVSKLVWANFLNYTAFFVKHFEQSVLWLCLSFSTQAVRFWPEGGANSLITALQTAEAELRTLESRARKESVTEVSQRVAT